MGNCSSLFSVQVASKDGYGQSGLSSIRGVFSSPAPDCSLPHRVAIDWQESLLIQCQIHAAVQQALPSARSKIEQIRHAASYLADDICVAHALCHP